MPTELHELGFDYPIVAQKNKDKLNTFGPRAIEDYTQNKEDLIRWLLTVGRNPFKKLGYSPETVRKSHYKIEKTYRWLWKDKGRYCWRFQPQRATEYLDYLVRFTDTKEPQIVEYEKALKILFSYWTETTDSTIDWKYDRTLASTYNSEKDYFRPTELRALYETSLSYNTIKNAGSTQKRAEMAGILARRFNTSIENITEEHFKRANSWKIPSLVSTSNDLGLRPREIEIAKTYWVDIENNLIRIPEDESVKSSSSWQCAISSQTAAALRRWLEERETYEVYEDTDQLWLNDDAGPYNNRSVNYLLDKLMTDSDINEGQRNLTWYSIRHGVATLWANNEGVQHAQEQLRHEKPKTTMEYVHNNKEEQIEKADDKW